MPGSAAPMLIALARLLPIALQMPRLPWAVRVGAAVSLSAVFAGFVSERPPDAAGLSALLVRELAVGAALGFAASLVFRAVEAAAGLIHAAMEPAGDAAIRPAAGPTDPALLLLAGVVFFAAEGHRLLLRAIADGYAAVPPGGAVPAELGELLLAAALRFPVIAAQTAWPVVFAVLAADLTAAVVCRLLPETAVWAAARPVRFWAGVAALAASAGVFAETWTRALADLAGRMAFGP